jgi:hypothetical protein
MVKIQGARGPKCQISGQGTYIPNNQILEEVRLQHCRRLTSSESFLMIFAVTIPSLLCNLCNVVIVNQTLALRNQTGNNAQKKRKKVLDHAKDRLWHDRCIAGAFQNHKHSL